MAYNLLLGSTTENWRIHPTEDIADAERRLSDASERGGEAIVRVILGDGVDPFQLHVRPSLVPWWVIVHVIDPDE